MPIPLNANSISLRPITFKDTDNIVRWRNDPGVLKNFIDQRLITIEGHKQWLETMVFPGHVHQFIIETPVGSVGSVFLKDIDRVNQHAEFGIFIGEPSARGRGYGTISCRLACDYAFKNLCIERVFLRVLAENSSAIASYQKVGFIREGLFRKHVFVNGCYSDVVFMGILKAEYLDLFNET